MALSRRAFLKAAGLAGATSATLPTWWPGWIDPAWAAAPAPTTLRRTLVRGTALSTGSAGSTYYRLAEGPGEPHVVRMDLIRTGGSGLRRFGGRGRRSLLNFAHLTDVRVIDAQSPSRVEFLDRYATGPGHAFVSTYRPQEVASVQVLEAMVRSLRSVGASPVSGNRISFAVCTGDNIENDQLNELRWFVDTLDGGQTVTPGSGGPGYEGVMSPTWNDPGYWHPEPGLYDNYKLLYGFPSYPKFLERATSSFRSTGLGIPWFQTFGSHDGLVQGNVPRNPFFNSMATGGVKVRGLPDGIDPLNGYTPIAMYVRTLLGHDKTGSPAAFEGAPTQQVTPDSRRRILTRQEYIQEMFNTTGAPAGHGFTQANLEQADGSINCYWHSDDYRYFRLIGLDTVNPGGHESGSIGAKQLAWLERQLVEVSSHYYDASGASVSTGNRDRYVILFSHHGLRSLDNKEGGEIDQLQLEINDLPRHLADDVAALVHRFPNVIAWVSGHARENSVSPRPDPAGRSGGFWDIATGAHADWACQARLVDVVDNNNGSLSIYCTMVDHAGPAVPGGPDAVLRAASIARELAANDIQNGYEGPGRGRLEDRNVELVIKAPFRRPHPVPAPEHTGVPRG
jgi:metallophosphoesterase (TIGR03767 family)